MRILGYVVSRSIKNGLSGGQSQALNSIKALSTNAPLGNWMDGNQRTNSFEPEDEFERRIFGGNSGGNSRSESFFQKLDRLAKPRDGAGSSPYRGNSSQMLDGRGEVVDTLSDGMDEKLEKAAGRFEIDDDDDDAAYDEEVSKENYSFRPDATFSFGNTYDIKDLDLTKPGVRRPEKRNEFEVTTEEVLRKADFRNVRFLANFITEAGIIIKRSKTGISAKAQRKVAREIKTARAFGLMPFTTMGTKSFVFGRTMESLDHDFDYEILDRSIDNGKDLDES